MEFQLGTVKWECTGSESTEAAAAHSQFGCKGRAATGSEMRRGAAHV